MSTRGLAGQRRRAQRPAVQVACDGVRIPLARARVERLARYVLRAERTRNAVVSVTFVRPAAIAALNRIYLRRRGATDVIAFGFDVPVRTAAPESARRAVDRVGDIYVCPDVARLHARGLRVALRDELARLVVHGVLHVAGWDHPEGAERVDSPMWKRQERLLRAWQRSEART